MTEEQRLLIQAMAREDLMNWKLPPLDLGQNKTESGSKFDADNGRVQILEESARLTGVERANEYGDPAVNLKLAGELKALLRLHRVRLIGPAEQEALDHVCVKLARIVTGPKPKHDNYVDGAAYFAIAGEMAAKET